MSPVPECDNQGFLPEGVFDCSLEELKDRFASLSEERFRFFGILELFLARMKEHGKSISAIFIDGTFVSTHIRTTDIDVLILMRDTRSFSEVDDIVEAFRSPEFDVNAFHEESELAKGWLNLFRQFDSTKYPTNTGWKGFLRLKT